MDPNANIREQIALLALDGRVDILRREALEDAYADWRGMGGFAADATLLASLRAAREEASS